MTVKKIKSWNSSNVQLYIQSIDGDQYNQILALLENCNLDNATGDVINEIVENLNKIYIWVLEKMTKKIKHQTDVMILSPVVQMYAT